MGRFHAEKLAQLAGEGAIALAGVCDADPERAEEVARKLGTAVLRRVEDVARAADAAVVAVPTSHHARIAAQLLEAGLDCLVELAKAHGRVLQVGHIERFSRAFRAIRPALGRPRFIEAHRIGPYPARATDVSVVLDLMIHDLDIVAELAGSEVERVEAVGVPVLSKTEDIANARLRLAGGCVVNLTASRVSLEKLRKVRLFQSDAYVSLDLGENRITLVRREGAPGGAEAPRITAEKLEFDAADALLAQDRAFAECVRTRAEPEVSGADGERALDLALRIQEAIEPVEGNG